MSDDRPLESRGREGSALSLYSMAHSILCPLDLISLFLDVILHQYGKMAGTRVVKYVIEVPVKNCTAIFSFFDDWFFLTKQADRGFATSRFHSDEDGTILAHILHGSNWCIKKGGERSAGSGLNERFLSSASLLLKWYYMGTHRY